MAIELVLVAVRRGDRVRLVSMQSEKKD